MTTPLKKGPRSSLPKLRIEIGRGQSRIQRAIHLNTDNRFDESTPLTDYRLQVDSSTYIDSGLRERVSKSRRLSRSPENNPPRTPLPRTCVERFQVCNRIQDIGEEKIKLFAFRLAFIEKAASNVRYLTSLWATVVILGGFATSLTFSDFGVVAAIILAEAVRIFIRSHELGWRVELGWEINSIRDISIVSSRVRLVDYFLRPDVMSSMLDVLQTLSAWVCIGLSIWRLSVQEFCFDDEEGSSCQSYRLNVAFSMNFFHCMAIVEAALSLIGKGYFFLQMRYNKLLTQVRTKLTSSSKDLEPVVFESFYYMVYNKCLKGSIFDGFNMSLAAFGMQWLQSDDFDQQIQGAKLLHEYVSAEKAHRQGQTADALRRLATTPGVIERLGKMLCLSFELEKKLVGENDPQNALSQQLDHRKTGLKILKYLFTNHASSLEIRETRDFLPILVNFIKVKCSGAAAYGDPKRMWRVSELSLKVLLCLAANETTSGSALRTRMAGIVSFLKILRDVLKECDENPYQQFLSMQILYHLALEEDVRCSIGATGGIIRFLFDQFRKNDALKSENLRRPWEKNFVGDIKRDAIEMSGRVLSRLMLQSQKNCLTLLTLKDKKDGNKLPVVDVMIGFLRAGDEGIGESAARILRSVLKYADANTRAEIAERSAPIALQNIFNPTADTRPLLYEVCLGLASRAIEELTEVKYRNALSQGLVLSSRHPFMSQLVENLMHSPTTNKIYRIRRYSLEVIIALVQKDRAFCRAAASVNMEEELEISLDFISEVENFILIYGSEGHARYTEDIKELVLRCIETVKRRVSYSLEPTSSEDEDSVAP